MSRCVTTMGNSLFSAVRIPSGKAKATDEATVEGMSVSSSVRQNQKFIKMSPMIFSALLFSDGVHGIRPLLAKEYQDRPHRPRSHGGL